MQKQLNKIISEIDLNDINLNLVLNLQIEEVTPSVTIADTDSGVFTLEPIKLENTFNCQFMLTEKMIILRYAITKEMVEKLVDFTQISKFQWLLKKSIKNTLYKLTENNLKLTEAVTLEHPAHKGSFVLARENGDFEIRAFCKVLL